MIAKLLLESVTSRITINSLVSSSPSGRLRAQSIVFIRRLRLLVVILPERSTLHLSKDVRRVSVDRVRRRLLWRWRWRVELAEAWVEACRGRLDLTEVSGRALER